MASEHSQMRAPLHHPVLSGRLYRPTQPWHLLLPDKEYYSAILRYSSFLLKPQNWVISAVDQQLLLLSIRMVLQTSSLTLQEEFPQAMRHPTLGSRLLISAQMRTTTHNQV